MWGSQDCYLKSTGQGTQPPTQDNLAGNSFIISNVRSEFYVEVNSIVAPSQPVIHHCAGIVGATHGAFNMFSSLSLALAHKRGHCSIASMERQQDYVFILIKHGIIYTSKLPGKLVSAVGEVASRSYYNRDTDVAEIGS